MSPGRAAAPPGNRIWSIETKSGRVVQKFYRERDAWLRARVKSGLVALGGQKTSTRARARRTTERELLALWHQYGVDVPAELSAEHPELAGSDVLVLEFVPGGRLAHVLVEGRLPDDDRAALLVRFAREWGRRHGLAVDHDEARLVQEHGTLQHVLWSGERLVTFDLENGFRAGADPRPLVSKEISGYLRSLAKVGSRERLEADLRIIVDAYPRPELLRAAVDRYLDNPSGLQRWRCRADERLARRRSSSVSKYEVLRLLDAVLKRVPNDGEGD